MLAFWNFLRVPPEMFDEVLARVGPHIQRLAIDSGSKLAATFRYLVTGESYPAFVIPYSFRVPCHTVDAFIPIVARGHCRSVQRCNFPLSCNCWRMETDRLWIWKKRLNVSHYRGAMDGKHWAIKKPPNSGGRWTTTLSSSAYGADGSGQRQLQISME